ncbi:MAG: hypothetical protein HC923_10110 [Myxococcales bacterium]|nr:hypothetical protein [Myxococcales bacterium]
MQMIFLGFGTGGRKCNDEIGTAPSPRVVAANARGSASASGQASIAAFDIRAT